MHFKCVSSCHLTAWYMQTFTPLRKHNASQHLFSPSILLLLSNNHCSVSRFYRFDYLDVSCTLLASLWIMSPKSIHVEACVTVPFFFFFLPIMFICCGYNTFYFCDLCKNVCYHYTRSELLRALFYTLMHCHLIFLKILQQFTFWPAAYKHKGFHSSHIVAGLITCVSHLSWWERSGIPLLFWFSLNWWITTLIIFFWAW